MSNSDIVIAGLLILGVGCIAYEAGKNKGNNEGYNRAQVQHSQWIRQISAENIYLNADKARLSEENGSIYKENEVLKGLLRQQPTTPQAEAILKAVERVEFRLIQALPPIFEAGEDHNTETN